MGQTILLGRDLRGVCNLGIAHFLGALLRGIFAASGRFFFSEPDPLRPSDLNIPQAGTCIPPQLEEVEVSIPAWQPCLLPLSFTSMEGSPQSLPTNAADTISSIPTLAQELIMSCYSTGEETAFQAVPPLFNQGPVRLSKLTKVIQLVNWLGQDLKTCL